MDEPEEGVDFFEWFFLGFLQTLLNIASEGVVGESFAFIVEVSIFIILLIDSYFSIICFCCIFSQTIADGRQLYAGF